MNVELHNIREFQVVATSGHTLLRLSTRGLDDEVKGLQNYKADVREQLMGGGYSNWGILGDQYSSIEGLPRAKRTFKLPNPLYYVS
ncbi:hypothetical protein M0R45_018534 [Rubus argutus]|uniref:Uncharacterized protein n=1 Tax=Rubus argutus TaxID=59490 RepID=A0AAW1X2R7_RUBAR